MDARTPTIFCLTTNRLIDLIRQGETAATALTRLQSYGPDLAILPLAEAQARYERQFKTEPVEIDEGAWHEALNVLPPEDWRNDANGESFKCSEPTAGSITAICRSGSKRVRYAFTLISPAPATRSPGGRRVHAPGPVCPATGRP